MKIAVLCSMVIMGMLLACSRNLISPGKNSERLIYDSRFPDKDCNDQLNRVFQSVRKVVCYTNYRTYVFSEESRITLQDLGSSVSVEKRIASLVSNEATTGTALIIQSDAAGMVLITCSHIVNLPDTVIKWKEYSGLGSEQYIQSISLKTGEKLIIKDVPEGNSFVLLAVDRKSDLALLGRKTGKPSNTSDIPSFPYPVGDSDQLGWGSFLYLLGFPSGQKMITCGIASIPAAKDGNFLTDAPFNEGFSGGVILAVKNGTPNFEWVGIGRAVATRNEYVLKPEKEIHEVEYNPSIPYKGEIYIKQNQDLSYGITWFIPVNKVKEFYSDKRGEIILKGYNLDDFFGIR